MPNKRINNRLSVGLQTVITCSKSRVFVINFCSLLHDVEHNQIKRDRFWWGVEGLGSTNGTNLKCIQNFSQKSDHFVELAIDRKTLNKTKKNDTNV